MNETNATEETWPEDSATRTREAGQMVPDDEPDWRPVLPYGDEFDWEALDSRVERRERLIGLLEELAEYTPDNRSKDEYANVQARIKTIMVELEALTPTALATLPGLSEILDSIIAEVHRFFVVPERDAQIIALWIVHTHVFLHEIDDKGGKRSIFDHTPRLILWSQTHGSGKSTLAEFITRLSPNVEIVASLRGSEFIAFLRREAEKRNDPFLQQFYKEKAYLPVR